MKKSQGRPLLVALIACWGLWVTAGLLFPISSHVEKYENRKDGKTAIKEDGPSNEPFVLRVIDFLDTHNGVVTAIATIAIAYFTLSLRRSTDRLWDSAEKQMGVVSKQLCLAHEEFVLVHRPRLRVRNFRIDIDSPAEPAFAGQFYVVNIGNTTAQITHSHVIIDWRRDALPMKRPYDGCHPNNLVSGTLKAGDALTVPIGSHLVVQDESVAVSLGDSRESIMGYIDYLDRNGTRRRTAFCRTFDRERKRFVRSENEDYEHEE